MPQDSSGPRHSLVGKLVLFLPVQTLNMEGRNQLSCFMITLLHHGMIIAGLPYTFDGQTTMDEIVGGSPYGASL